MTDETPKNEPVTKGAEPDLTEVEQPEKPPTPLERLLERFKRAYQGSRPPSPATRKELGKDKSKALFVLVAAVIAVLLFFFAVFSSPDKLKRNGMWQHEGQPDLGRRVTPGQERQQAGSVTPLLSAATSNQATLGNGEVTPEDIKRTSQASLESGLVRPSTTANTLVPPTLVARSSAQATATTASAPITNTSASRPCALSHINFSDPALQEEYAKAGYRTNYTLAKVPSPGVASQNSESDLKKPSLVFVRSENTTAGIAPSLTKATGPVEMPDVAVVEPPSLDSILPPGTRLIARLESPASTAVAGPVVAAIEYNYEREGEIVVPAGSKAIGKLEQANPSGYVSLHFTLIEFPDGTTEKIDGVSMGLNYAPVKGLVNGRKRGARFLVHTLTGLGTMASYLVGAGSFSGPLSESAFLRERIADNAAIAGQDELNQMAFNQSVVVTVPGNTRFYIVFQKTYDASGRMSRAHHTNYGASSVGEDRTAPSLEELRQLLQLRQELSQLYPQGASEIPQSSVSQNQQ